MLQKERSYKYGIARIEKDAGPIRKYKGLLCSDENFAGTFDSLYKFTFDPFNSRLITDDSYGVLCEVLPIIKKIIGLENLFVVQLNFSVKVFGMCLESDF